MCICETTVSSAVHSPLSVHHPFIEYLSRAVDRETHSERCVLQEL